jgi:predicted GNAT family acetyltransferase
MDRLLTGPSRASLGDRVNSSELKPAGFRDNQAQHRFELDTDGRMAFAYYRLSPGVITFTHTEVPAEISGRGIGSRLIHAALAAAQERGLKVVPRCSFVTAYIAKHPAFADLLR